MNWSINCISASASLQVFAVISQTRPPEGNKLVVEVEWRTCWLDFLFPSFSQFIVLVFEYRLLSCACRLSHWCGNMINAKYLLLLLLHYAQTFPQYPAIFKALLTKEYCISTHRLQCFFQKQACVITCINYRSNSAL